MTSPVYATVEEFWAQTGRQGVYVRAARKLAAADAAADTLTLEGHGFATDTPLQFVANLGGTLPAPLSAGVLYYAKPVTGSSSLFQVASAPGGSAVNLTSAGAGSFAVAQSVVPMIERKLEIASRTIDRMTRGHAVPQGAPYPVEVVSWCITLAEWHVARELGKLEKDDPIDMGYREAMADLAKLEKGQQMRDPAATAAVNLAVSSSGTLTSGWVPAGGRIP